MTSPADRRDFSVTAVRLLVEAFLAEDPLWQEWNGDAATILDIGDLEVRFVLTVRKGAVTFETIERDHRSVSAVFARELDAWRFLIMRLGDSWRWARRMPEIDLRAVPPGTTLERVPSGHRLRWPGGEATFRSEFDAFDFSRVASAAPADIATSYRHVNWQTALRPGRRTGCLAASTAPCHDSAAGEDSTAG
jgi:hypothetical protein